MLISKGVKDLCASILDRPDRWTQGSYEFINKDNAAIRIWTANGASHIALNGNDAFNMFEKWKLNSVIKMAIARQSAIVA